MIRLTRHFSMFLVILLVAGFLAATLVRLAPGFGTDERMLDPQLNAESLQALARSHAEGSNVASYYVTYLGKLARGDLGISVSVGGPVRELLAERIPVSVRSLAAGLLLAWATAFAAVLAIKTLRRPLLDHAAAIAAGAMLCVPAAVIALSCFYVSGTPALAIAAILFPRVFRYLESVARQACSAAHVLAAQAFGQKRLRVFAFHVLVPALHELLALAGISVSMGVGAMIPVEALCDSPGVGQLVWQAALARDLPVIVNVTLLITALTVAANFAADAGRAAREAAI